MVRQKQRNPKKIPTASQEAPVMEVNAIAVFQAMPEQLSGPDQVQAERYRQRAIVSSRNCLVDHCNSTKFDVVANKMKLEGGEGEKVPVGNSLVNHQGPPNVKRQDAVHVGQMVETVIAGLKNTYQVVRVPEEDNEELPTMSMPLYSNVSFCCKLHVLEASTPPFPGTLPELSHIKYVVVYCLLPAEGSQHEKNWRFLTSPSHMRKIPWIRTDHTMTMTERSSVMCLKDNNKRMISQFMTFMVVEDGK